MNKISRRKFLTATGSGAFALAFAPVRILFNRTPKESKDMYGLIGKMTAKTGKRDNLIKILIEGAAEMPGCLSYIVSKDSENDDAILITEAWKSKEDHQASLLLPSVKEAISQGRPLIESFDMYIEMEPVGGHGLVSADSE